MANNPLSGGFAGGTELGAAHASITISTDSLRDAGQAARAAGQQIEQSFASIDKGAAAAQAAINGVAQSMQQMQAGIPFGKLGEHGLEVIDLDALQAARTAAPAAGQQISRAVDQIDASAKKAGASVLTLRNYFLALAAIRVAGGIFDAAETAARNEATKQSFQTLAASVGESANKMLAASQKASRGMVADSDLIADSNQAIQLRVVDSTQEFTQLIDAARVLSRAAGKDLTSSLEDLVKGLGRASPRILDNLNIANEGEEIFRKYAASMDMTSDQLDDATKKQLLLNYVMQAAKPLLDAEAKSADNVIDKFEGLRASFKNAKDSVGELLIAIGAPQVVDTFALSFKVLREQIEMIVDRINDLKTLLSGGSISFPQGSVMGNLFGSSPPPTPAGVGRDPIVEEDKNFDTRRTARIDFERQIQEIERSANEQRLDATQSYESQRSQTISEYERTIAREAEDFGRQRQRAAEELMRQIGDIEDEGRRQAAEWAADLAERIGELTEDSGKRITEAQDDTNKRISEIEENYQRSRERAERDHRDRLFDAAARLDAVAVFNEQRNFARQAEEAKEAHDDQIDKLNEQLAERTQKEQENLAERIDQEQKANAKRLADAKEADDRRILDMQEDFVRRQAEEDEDRAIRLQRMAEDHAAQLAQMDAAQAERLAQIARHEEEERKAAEDAHLTEMAKLGGTIAAGWKLVQDAMEDSLLQSYEDFVKKVNDRYRSFKQKQAEAEAGPSGGLSLSDLSSYATGGWVNRTGPIMAHAGEYVLTRHQAARGGASLHVGELNVYGTPGMNPEDLARAVRGELVDLLEEVSQ